MLFSISFPFPSVAYCHYGDGKSATQLQGRRKGERAPAEGGEVTQWVGGKSRKMVWEARRMQPVKKRKWKATVPLHSVRLIC